MAYHSSDRGAPALADLATLINLLSLRAGNAIRPTISDAVGLDSDDILADGNEVSDAEGSVDTANQDGQHQPLDGLRRRFIDRIAELFAAERNGSFVTAAVLREKECEDHVDIWLARNNGFKTDKDKEMIIATELALNKLARGDENCMLELQQHMLRYSSQRLKYYNDALTKRLAPLGKMAPDSTCTTDECTKIWSDIHSHFFTPRSLSQTEFQRSERLVILGADVRRAIHAGIDLCKGLHVSTRASEARKAITILCLVGKIASACHVFEEVSTKIWQGYTFKITAVQVPLPARAPKNSIDVLSAMRRVGVPSDHPAVRAFDSKSGAAARFAEKQKQQSFVHAEVQLLFYLAKNRIQDMFPYVGASKLPCVLCATLLKAHGMLDCRETHEHFYEKWMVPEIKTLPRDVREDMWGVVARLRDSLRDTLLSLPAKGGDFRPESTVDMTVASTALTAAALSTANLSFASAIKQAKQAEEQGMLSRFFDLRLPVGSEHSISAGNSPEGPEIEPSQHVSSDSSESYSECEGCERPTSRRCGRCDRGRFCSLSYEKNMSPAHKFNCSNGALTTADRLLCDCVEDNIPDDPDVLEDYGFTQLWTFEERSKLFGVYKGLYYLEVGSDELHEWQESGALVERIVETFAKLPVEHRGSYMPWFLENTHRIFPPAQSSADEVDDEDRYFKSVRFLLDEQDRLKPVKDLQPCSKRNSFTMAALVIHSWYPPPGSDGPYYDFGFCACLNESEEQTLGVAYQRSILGDEYSPQQLYWEDLPASSINPVRFAQFWQAFENGTLIQFMERNGFPEAMMGIRHLATYLNGSTEVQNLPVWDLLTFVKCGDAAPPPDSIFTRFGFYGCGADPRIVCRLKRLYASLLACVNIIELQEAQTSGRLLGFARRYVDVDLDLAAILGSCLEMVSVRLPGKPYTGSSPV